MYVDLLRLASPCMIAAVHERPDVFSVQEGAIVPLELTLGFETNMELNSKREREKYKALVGTLTISYHDNIVGNIAMGNLRIH